MKRTLPAISLAVLVGLTSGCAMEASTDAPEDQPQELTATANPCQHTVARVETEEGTTLYFCRLDDATVGVLESASQSAPPLDLDGLDCADELFRRVAPREPVPPALTEACALKKEADLQAEVIEPWSSDSGVGKGDGDDLAKANSAPEATKNGEIGQVQQALSNYCGSNGAVNFQNELCFGLCGGNTTCICQPLNVTWHQRTCSATVGDWCRHSSERISSCGTWTQFRAYKGKSLNLSLDYWVAPGGTASWTMWAPRKGLLYGWKDSDFRYRGDSQAGGYHRYATLFMKN